MQKILISSCLLGDPVRYDGQASTINSPLLQHWFAEQRLVPICPEIAGGLPCPRPAAEIEQGRGDKVLNQRDRVLSQRDKVLNPRDRALNQQARVLCRDGTDVSQPFIAGAEAALALCQQHQIRFALLKARSPSCGSRNSYDGSFKRQLIDDGIGVTAALLRRHGIELFDENQLEQLQQALESVQ